MESSTGFSVGQAGGSAYGRTLRLLQRLAAHFPSWDAMVAEESDPDLSSSRTCTYHVKRPPQNLLEEWLLAAMSRYSKAKKDHGSHAGEATGRRWTRFLGLWISLRLAGLIASANASRDLAFWTETRREVDAYEQCFLCMAWSLLEADRRLRLQLRITHLRKLCSAALQKRGISAQVRPCAMEAAVEADDDSYETTCVTICNSAMRAAQCVAREYLHITRGALDPKQMPGVVNGRLQVLFSLQQPTGPLDTSAEQESTAPPSLAASKVVYTGCLEELLHQLQRIHQQQHTADNNHRVWMRVVRTALLQIGYNLVVKIRAGMIDFCYFLIPALVDYEACVMLCEIVENERASTVSPTSAVVAPVKECEEEEEEEERKLRSQLRRTLAALLQVIMFSYNAAVDKLLAGYRKACVSCDFSPFMFSTTAAKAPLNPLAPDSRSSPEDEQHTTVEASPSAREKLPPAPTLDGSSGAGGQNELALSQVAYTLLVEVVEPTCNILRRYPVDPKRHQKARSGSGDVTYPHQDGGTLPSTLPSTSPAVKQALVDFVTKKLKACFIEALVGLEANSASAKAYRQAAMDAYLVTTYFSSSMQR